MRCIRPWKFLVNPKYAGTVEHQYYSFSYAQSVPWLHKLNNNDSWVTRIRSCFHGSSMGTKSCYVWLITETTEGKGLFRKFETFDSDSLTCFLKVKLGRAKVDCFVLRKLLVVAPELLKSVKGFGVVWNWTKKSCHLERCLALKHSRNILLSRANHEKLKWKAGVAFSSLTNPVYSKQSLPFIYLGTRENPR